LLLHSSADLRAFKQERKSEVDCQTGSRRRYARVSNAFLQSCTLALTASPPVSLGAQRTCSEHEQRRDQQHAKYAHDRGVADDSGRAPDERLRGNRRRDLRDRTRERGRGAGRAPRRAPARAPCTGLEGSVYCVLSTLLRLGFRCRV
jgi:hypothetical protein